MKRQTIERLETAAIYLDFAGMGLIGLGFSAVMAAALLSSDVAHFWTACVAMLTGVGAFVGGQLLERIVDSLRWREVRRATERRPVREGR